MAKHHDDLVAGLPAHLKPLFDQLAADPLPLKIWTHRHRPEANGAVVCLLGRLDRDGAEQDMPDNLVAVDGHERDNRFVTPTHQVYQTSFIGPTERALVQFTNSGDVLGSLWSNVGHRGIIPPPVFLLT